jgi:amino acid transporter
MSRKYCMMTPSKTFVREATGLVRELSGFDAANQNFAFLSILIGTIWTFSWTPVVYPGANIVITLAVVVIPLLFLAQLYGVMTMSMARSGGDYVWTSRILHPSLGMLQSAFMVYYFFITIGMLSSFVAQFYLSPLCFAFGRLFGNPGLVAWGSTLLTPTWVFTIGTIAVAFYFICAVIPIRSYAKVQLVMFLGANFGMIVLILLLLSTSHNAAVAVINSRLAGSGQTYDSIIKLAQKNGYLPGWTVAESLIALPYAYSFYWGFYNSNWFAGEIKGGGSTMNKAVFAALLVAAFFAVIISYLTFNTFGFDFYNGLNYLYFGAPSAYPANTALFIPYLNYMATLLTDNWVIILIIVVGYLFNGLWQLASGILPATRQIFAWSFDRLIPEKFSEVSDRLHSPIWTMVTMSVLGEIAILLWIYTTLATYVVNTIIGLLSANLVVSVACFVFPMRRKELFESTVPTRWKRRIAGLPMLSWLSLIVMATTLYMLYCASTNAVVGGPISYASMFTGVIGPMIAGVLIYFIARAYRKSKGIDISLIFKEIPPE